MFVDVCRSVCVNKHIKWREVVLNTKKKGTGPMFTLNGFCWSFCPEPLVIMTALTRFFNIGRHPSLREELLP